MPMGVETSENRTVSGIDRAGATVLKSISSGTHAFEARRPDPELRRPLGKGTVLDQNDPTKRAGEPVESQDRLRRVVEERASERLEPAVAHVPPDLVREQDGEVRRKGRCDEVRDRERERLPSVVLVRSRERDDRRTSRSRPR